MTEVWIDGEFVRKEDAKISVYDHGLLYGDGVFEGIRVYDGKIFKLDEHIDRMFYSAKTILLELPMTKDAMKRIIVECVRRNRMRDCYIRLVVTRGRGDLGIDPRKCKKPCMFVIVDTIKLYPKEFYESGLAIVTVTQRRNFPEAINPKVKSLNYLNNILGLLEAIHAGAAEGIMLNKDGYVAEATADNIFIVKYRKNRTSVITPPPYVGALEGITRDAILELAEEMGYDAREDVFTRHAIYTADECFLTGTGAEIIPVVKVDGRVVGEGKPG